MGARLALIIIIFTSNGCAGLTFLTGNDSLHPCLFQYDGVAQSVCIAGDFNQWRSDTHCLRPNKGIWAIRLLLPSGTHRYAFIIDRNRWVTDPKALYTENDGFGRKNSVVVIE